MKQPLPNIHSQVGSDCRLTLLIWQRFFKSEYYLALLLITACFLGCNATSEPAKTGEQNLTVEQQMIERAMRLANSKNAEAVYQQKEAGETTSEEVQKSGIFTLREGKVYQYVEVYNVYEDGAGKSEYYIQEFRIRLDDTTNRQSIMDYQIVSGPDSTFISQTNKMEFRLAGSEVISANGVDFTVYKLNGFAHEGDPKPAHYKFWSPQFGTLLIYYGNQRTFELVHTAENGDSAIILQLKNKIRSRLTD